jgi:hypothetical protein
MLTGAIIGAIAGLLTVIIMALMKTQKFSNIMKSVTDPGVEYSALFYYASVNRYQKAFRIYDSYGALYLIGNTVYYKTSTTGAPMTFNLAECKVQQEANWRRVQWFSITTPAGEKHYFDSFKQGAFTNNSDETLKAFTLFKSKTPA